MSAPGFLPLAAEQFLGKSVDHIKSLVLQTVEDHMRAVIGTQTIEDISKNRQGLANMIRETATKDLSRMGIDIVSLTIKDIKDDVEYLSSAGKRTAAHVKRDAAVEAANAESEAAQVAVDSESAKQERDLHNKSSLARQKHEMDVSKAVYNEDVGRIKAEAAKSYDLQLAHLQKAIRTIEMEVKSIGVDGLIEIQKKENELRKTELEMEIDPPTKAEVYDLKKQIKAAIAKQKAEMETEEFRIQVEGEGRAKAAKIKGEAEAEGMKLLADVRKEFNETAVLFEVLKILPDVAAIVLLSYGINDKKPRDDKKSMSVFATEATKLSSSVQMAVRAPGGSDQTSSNLLNSILQLQKSAGLILTDP